MQKSFLTLALLGMTVSLIWAIDINPSKNTAPRSSYDTGGNRFSIFNGDPKRIQRANAVDFKMFDTKLEVSPNPAPVQSMKASNSNPALKIAFSVHNHGKKTYTLSFPTAQRWDFRIVAADGTVVYTYADDHEFMEVVGTSMVNNDDKLVYKEAVALSDLSATLTPGQYTVQALLSNYPELNAQATLVVQNTEMK